MPRTVHRRALPPVALPCPLAPRAGAGSPAAPCPAVAVPIAPPPAPTGSPGGAAPDTRPAGAPDRAPRRRILRAATLALLTGLALLLGAAPALAHTKLIGSDPADGASTATGPHQVSLTFNEPVQPGFSTVTVIGPDGVDYRGGDPAEAEATVRIPARPLGPAGVYRIGFRVVSADGHPVSGSVSFTLTQAGPASTAPRSGSPSSTAAPAGVVPTAAPAPEAGAPVWPWVVGAVLLVGAGVVVALRLGRR